MARRWSINIIGICLALTGCQTYTLREGDLLFHVTREANAITDVTPAMIDHVAIVVSKDSVIEAVPRGGVVTTPLDSLRRQEGHYIVGKVRGIDRRRSVSNARHYLGRAYDALFLPDNEAVYCSELVQLSMVDRRGRLLFQPVPMSFHDASGHITPYWTDFYARHGIPVPEGQPGTNPAELSQRKNVRITGPLQGR